MAIRVIHAALFVSFLPHRWIAVGCLVLTEISGMDIILTIISWELWEVTDTASG